MKTKYGEMMTELREHGSICSLCIHHDDDNACAHFDTETRSYNCEFEWIHDGDEGFLDDEESTRQYENAVAEIRTHVAEDICHICNKPYSEYCESCYRNPMNLRDPEAPAEILTETMEEMKNDWDKRYPPEKAKRDIWKTTKIVITAAGLICAVVTAVAMLNQNGDLAYRTGTCFWLMMCGERMMKLVEETE